MNNFLFLKIYILLCRLFGYSVFLAGFFMSDNFGFLCGKKSIFFCGIGGASMSGLAAICSLNGFSVSGSDCDISSDTLSFLQSYGIRVFTSHSAENIAGSDAFVYTAAVNDSNPELRQAGICGIPVYTRSRFLGCLADCFPHSIAVAGTHGKSTVTHMTGKIFKDSSVSSALLAGAADKDSGLSFRNGGGCLIFEACEFNRSFLDFHPETSVILNIEKEHTDTYPTLRSAEDGFGQFAAQSKTCIVNLDCYNSSSIIPFIQNRGVRILTFSLTDKNADAFATETDEKRGLFSFTGCIKQQLPFRCSLSVPGIHNVSNALAAALCASVYGIKSEIISSSLSGFTGLKRRFEYIGNYAGADIYDDYAHHPTEIRATLKTARSLGYKRIICAFQPHTYSRTYSLFRDFTAAFTDCDLVIFADIFPAREVNIYGVSSEMLAASTENAIYIPSFEGIYRFLAENAEKDTMILTMGAGKLNRVSYALAHAKD